MTSFIAFLIAITFGTANVQQADYQSMNSQEETQQFGKDDGIGMGGSGGQVTEDPNGRD